MNRRRICWVTADYFFDVDMPIISGINERFDLKWIIVNSYKNVTDHNKTLDKTINKDAFKYEIFNLRSKFGNISIILDYLKIFYSIKKSSPDIIYLDIMGFPYFLPLAFLLFNRRKIVYAAHNVSTPKGALNGTVIDKLQKAILTVAHNIHVFSDNQKAILQKRYKNKNVLKTPLALKDFGDVDISKSKSEVVFLFFGYIRDYKRLDLLINAAEEISKKTSKKFKILIAGYCEHWEIYEKIIKSPEIFDLNIRIIDDNEIPVFFKKSHYLVLPYQDSTQSGVLAVAYNYNIPCIASKIKSFEEFIEHDKNGYLFENCSMIGLQEIMLDVIEKHEQKYHLTIERLSSYVRENLSTTSILTKYIKYLEEI